ncbi:MAG: hypothetical protein J1F39_02070 [Clostridiales bacterium]|nr:hypothetical protein [Clostridiales bacterium]
MARPLIKKRAPFSRRHLSIIFILLTIAALFVLMGFSMSAMDGTTVYVPDGDTPNIMHTAVPTDGSRPSDHNALESLSYAAERIYSSSYFKGETIGTVISDVGLIKHLQNVHNIRVVKGGYIFAEAISSSTLKSVGEQKFFAGKDTILYRPATKVGDGVATFSDKCSRMGLDDFYSSYGVIPNEITKHIINTEVIQSIQDDNALVKPAANSDGEDDGVLLEVPEKLMQGDDGYYRFTLNLDPDGATKFYRNEVMTLAGANYISFKSVKLSFTIDENWYPISVESNETYEISIPSMSFLGVMTMRSSLTETFTDIDKDGEIPEYDFFSNHFNADVTEGDLPSTLGPSDYLAEAFGPYLAGKDLDLEANIAINGKDVGGALNISVNLDTMVIKAKLGALFVQYGGDRLYVSANNLKGYISTDKAKALLKHEALSSLLGELDFDNLLGDDILGTVMSNCEMTTDGDLTTVRIPFSLTDGVDVDAALIIGDGMKLNAVTASINLNGTMIEISAVPKSTEFPAVDDSYKDISGALDIVSDLLDTPGEKKIDINDLTAMLEKVLDVVRAKGLSAPISISAGDFTLSALLSLGFKNGLAVKLDGTNFPLSVVYTDGTVYITLGGIKISCDEAGLNSLISSLDPVLPSGIGEMLSSLDKIDVKDTAESIISAIKELSVNKGIISVKLDINGITAKLDMNTDLSRTALNFTVENTNVRIDLGNVTAGSQAIVKPVGAFIPAQNLSTVLDAVLPLATAEGYKLSFNGTLLGATIVGGITVALPDGENSLGLSLELDIADVKGVSVTLAGGVLYVVIPDTISVSCGIENGELDSLINEIKEAVPNGSETSDALIAITDLINVFSSAQISDIIGALYGVPEEDGFTLGADFNSVGAELAAQIKIKLDGGLTALSLTVDALGKSVTAEIITALGEDGALKSLTADIDEVASFTVSVDSLARQSVSPKENCISIATYSQLISPILSLIETHGDAKTVSLDINASLTEKSTGNYVDITCKNLTVSFGEKIALRATVTLFSTTEAAQDVTITFVDGVIYIEAGSIALSFDTTADIERIYSVLEKYLPAYLAEELKNLLGLGDGTSSFSEIGLIADRIKAMVENPTFDSVFKGLFTDLGALHGKSAALTLLDMIELSEYDGTPVIHATVMGITLKVTPLLTEVKTDETTELRLVGAEISTELFGMIIVVKATDVVSHTTETAIYPPDDRQYVSVMEFVQVADMAISTFTTVNPLEKDEITFDIPSFSFTYDVYATETEPADTIKVTGRENSALKGKFTKHVETDESGNESSTFSVALEAHISLDMVSAASTTGVIDIDLYIIDRYPESPVAYLGYVENGTGYGELVSIDFTSVMQIVAAAMDIIGVDDETVEALVGPYRLPIDKTVFGYMNIVGLDKVKTILNDLASTINNATAALDEVKSALDIVTNAGSFDGLKNSLDDVKRHIANAIELFGISVDDDNESEYVGAAIDGSMFKRIVSGIAFGYEDNNLWADIANEITTGADGTAKVAVFSDGNVLNEVSVTNLDAKTARVDMDVKFVAGGTVEMSPIPTKDQYKAKVDYSDLGNIKHLLFDVMNTANLAEFEIGGGSTSDRIKLSLSLIGIINDSISIKYNVKVKLLTKSDRRAMGLTVTDDEPEVKTAAFVELIYDDCKIVLQQAVGDCTTRLYFFDDLIYIDGVRSWEKVTRGGLWGIGGTSFFDCKREYRVYTLDDLSAMFADPTLTTFFNDFLFLLVPLSTSILGINMQQVIIDEVAKSATEETDKNPTIATVFKGYDYDGAKHTVSVGLKELTGSTALSDITVSLTGANDGDDNILDNYVTAAQITTGAIGVSAANVKIDLTATLRNVQEYTSEEGIRMIKSKGLTSYTIHDVYLDNNKKDVGKNVSYPDIMSLLLGELPIAGSSSNPWQYGL